MTEEAMRHLTTAPADEEAVSRGRNLIVVIGIDAYAELPKLRNAVSDARGVYRLFVEKLGFESPLEPLLDADASKDAILAWVEDELPSLLQPDDNLVVFFAGHGHTRVQRVATTEIETGYIIPCEARVNRWSDYIKIDALLDGLSALPARHVLLILDACRSGFALGNAMQQLRSLGQYEEDLIKRTSRKVITSARRDEDAVDAGPVAGHSLFTGTLVQGLEWGTADLDGNGLVTSLELGLFLQQRVGQAADFKQTPDFGSFALDDRGEMVISLRENNFDAVKARAFTALRYQDLPQFRELVEKMGAARPDSPETRYLQYRLCLNDGDIEQAAAHIHQLRQMRFTPGTIPLSDQDLVELSVQLRFWKPVLALPSGDLPVAISLWVRSDGGKYAEAPRVEFPGGMAYEVPNRSIVRYRVRNPTDAPAHLYYMSITGRGTLRMGPLLEKDSERIDGLPPHAESVGPPFAIAGPPGLYETRLFYAPSRVSDLLFPPSVSMRSARPSSPEVEHVKTGVIWHQITGQEPIGDSLVFTGTEVVDAGTDADAGVRA